MKKRKKKDSSLAINGWLTLGTKWIRVYGRSTTPRGQGGPMGIGDWGLMGIMVGVSPPGRLFVGRRW